MNTVTNARDIRKVNKMRVLRHVCDTGAATKQQIAQVLGMSLPTVLQNIKELTDEGLLHALGPMESTGGRKAVALAPVEGARIAVGVGVWKDHIKLLLADLTGKATRVRSMRLAYKNEAPYYEAVARAVDAFLEENAVAQDVVLGVGFSIPGIVKGGTITDSHVLGIQNVPCAAFSGPVLYPCAFINDANAAALAEIHTENNSIDTFAYLSLNDCVGGSILIGGRMFLGENRRAGEFGHMRLLPFGRACYCGMEGCADAFLAAPVLCRHTGGNLDEFFSLLIAQERSIVAEWARYLDALAICLNNLRMAFDCPIVLGGFVGGYLPDFLEEIRARAGALNPFGGDGNYVFPCKCRKDASALGAAFLQRDAFFGLNRPM